MYGASYIFIYDTWDHLEGLVAAAPARAPAHELATLEYVYAAIPEDLPLVSVSPLIFSPVKDCYIRDTAPTTNHDTDNLKVGVGVNTDGTIDRALLHFDLSTIPVGFKVGAATLSVTTVSVEGGGAAGTIDRVSQPAWVENEVTWQRASVATDWTDGADFTADLTAAWTGPTGAGRYVIPGLAGLCNDALLHRAKQLHIILRLGNEITNNVNAIFRDSEYVLVPDRPVLTVFVEALLPVVDLPPDVPLGPWPIAGLQDFLFDFEFRPVASAVTEPFAEPPWFIAPQDDFLFDFEFRPVAPGIDAPPDVPLGPWPIAGLQDFLFDFEFRPVASAVTEPFAEPPWFIAPQDDFLFDFEFRPVAPGIDAPPDVLLGPWPVTGIEDFLFEFQARPVPPAPVLVEDFLIWIVPVIPDELPATGPAPAAAVPPGSTEPFAEAPYFIPPVEDFLFEAWGTPPAPVFFATAAQDELAYVLPFIADDLTTFWRGSPNTRPYNSYGVPFLYTADNWFGNFFVFEVYMRSTVSTSAVHARVYNETDGEPVLGSDLSTTSTDDVRLRTPPLPPLVDGKTYRAQMALSVTPVGGGRAKGAKLIAIRGIGPPVSNNLIFTPIKDASIHGDPPILDDTNFGDAGSCQVGNESAALAQVRTLMQFDVSAIPDGATIVEAHMVLHEFSLLNSVAAKVHRLTQPNWVELLCTWNIYDSGLPWTTPGGDFTDTDPVGVDWNLGPEGFTNLPGLAGLVQDAMNNRGKQLHVLMKIVTESAGVKIVDFHSKDFTSDPTLHPKLHVSWI